MLRLLYLIEGVGQRARKTHKILMSLVGFMRSFRNPLYIGVMLIVKAKTIEVRFQDSKRASVGRDLILFMFTLAYFHRILPVSVKNGWVELSDGSLVRTTSTEPYLDMLMSKGWQVINDIIKKGDVKLSIETNLSAIYETFELHVYDVDVAGSTVVDIGAGTGETSIYFAKRGAAKVVGVEPDVVAYNLAIRNQHLNPELDSIIELDLAYVGCSVYPKVSGPTKGKHTRQTTLSQLIERFDPPLVLKMDCEGCEFDLIMNEYDSIRRFDKLIFEYHPNMIYRSLNVLLRRLSNDFECTVGYGDRMLGILMCIKKQK